VRASIPEYVSIVPAAEIHLIVGLFKDAVVCIAPRADDPIPASIASANLVFLDFFRFDSVDDIGSGGCFTDLAEANFNFLSFF
jgi:hypothetical protein